MPNIYKILNDENVHTIVNRFKNGDYFGGTAKGLGLALQKTAAPLMERLVPMMKIHAFSITLQEEILKNKPADEAEYNRLARETWNRMDDRFGQMTYDNLFWNKSFKDVMHLITRSVGWNLGDIREVGMGVVDTAKFAGKVATLKARKTDITQRMMFLMALPLTTAYVGAMMTYMLTGEPPDELLDYFNPPTGKIKPDGTAQRLTIPTYFRDYTAMYKQGILTTLGHKTSPLLNLASEIIKGEDYFGQEIKGDDEKIVTAGARLLHSHLTPFSVQGAERISRTGGDLRDKTIAALGFTPSPRYITQSKEDKQIVDLFRRRNKGSRSPAAVERSRTLSKIEADWRLTGKWDQAALWKAKKEGLISNIRAFKNARRKHSGLVRMFKMLDAYDQSRLYKDFGLEAKKKFGRVLNLRARHILKKEKIKILR